MKIEIGETETQAINWGIPQLVISYEGKIVITNGKHQYYTFEGFCLDRKRFSEVWAKSCFEKFNGKITLSNE